MLDEGWFKSPSMEISLDHQSELVSLVSPLRVESTLGLVVVSEATNPRFGQLGLTSIVQVLAVGAEVVHHSQCLVFVF